MRGLPDDAPHTTALAAWLIDRHEADDRGPATPGLLERGRSWSRALLLSNDDQAALCGVLTIQGFLAGDEWDTLGVATQKRLAALPNFDQALAVVGATRTERFEAVQRRVEELARSGLAPDPLIDGEDLIGLGLTPGPAFRKILHAVYDAQLESTVTDREQAIDLARALGEHREG
jgi:hypothetical protein